MNMLHLSRGTVGYLAAEWTGSRSPWAEKFSAPFITLSRQAGSGGARLARILARRLEDDPAHDATWKIFDINLTARMLQTCRLPTRLARFLPEDRLPEVNACIGELVGLHPNLWELVQKTNETMRQLATKGYAILVGRGANFATKDIAHGVNVRLVAPPEHRARYLAQLYNISEKAALAYNARCEAARRRYVRTYFNADVDDPTAYDLVINTAQVPLDEAAELIARRLQQRTSVAA